MSVLTIIPEAWLHSRTFAIVSTFVAINTLVYLALALVKALPVVVPSRWLPHHYHRSETRSIYPELHERGPAARGRRSAGREATDLA